MDITVSSNNDNEYQKLHRTVRRKYPVIRSFSLRCEYFKALNSSETVCLDQFALEDVENLVKCIYMRYLEISMN